LNSGNWVGPGASSQQRPGRKNFVPRLDPPVFGGKCVNTPIAPESPVHTCRGQLSLNEACCSRARGAQLISLGAKASGQGLAPADLDPSQHHASTARSRPGGHDGAGHGLCRRVPRAHPRQRPRQTQSAGRTPGDRTGWRHGHQRRRDVACAGRCSPCAPAKYRPPTAVVEKQPGSRPWSAVCINLHVWWADVDGR
jgi:hypothetical protein